MPMQAHAMYRVKAAGCIHACGLWRSRVPRIIEALGRPPCIGQTLGLVVPRDSLFGHIEDVASPRSRIRPC